MSEQEVLNEVMQMLEAAPDNPKSCSCCALCQRCSRITQEAGCAIFHGQIQRGAWHPTFSWTKTKMWRNSTNDMRYTWAARTLKHWFKVFSLLAARRLVWSRKWMTWKLCKSNSMLSSVAGNMALCCGRMPADANTTLIKATYIDFEKEPAKEPSKEAHKESYKVFPLLYTELRNWIHLLKFQNLRKSLQKKPWASSFWQNVTRMKLLGTWGNQKNQKEPEVPA